MLRKSVCKQIVTAVCLFAVMFGCGPDPVKGLKNRFNRMIRELEQVETDGKTVSDHEMFYKHCREVLEEFRGSEYAVDRLKDLLLTSDAFTVRGGSALILGQLGTVKDTLPLINALGDSNAFVREKAAKALKEITHEDLGNDKSRWMDWWNTKENADVE